MHARGDGWIYGVSSFQIFVSAYTCCAPLSAEGNPGGTTLLQTKTTR